MNIKYIFDSFLIDTIESKVRMQHMIYRVMYRLGYREWVKKQVNKNIEKETNYNV